MPDNVHDGVPRLLTFSDLLSLSRFYSSPLQLRYFSPLGLAVGEGEAAGEGLAAGLDLVAGAVRVVSLGEADVDGAGLAVFGEFELLTGSAAQPAANTIEDIVRRITAVRLIMFSFDVVISLLPRSSKIEKRDDDCSFDKS